MADVTECNVERRTAASLRVSFLCQLRFRLLCFFIPSPRFMAGFSLRKNLSQVSILLIIISYMSFKICNYILMSLTFHWVMECTKELHFEQRNTHLTYPLTSQFGPTY